MRRFWPRWGTFWLFALDTARHWQSIAHRGVCSTFMVAGIDTMATTMSRILHQLAKYPEVQDRLRSEIIAAFEQYGAVIPYDELSELPYMDAICRETLRLLVFIVIRAAAYPKINSDLYQIPYGMDVYQRVSTFLLRDVVHDQTS